MSLINDALRRANQTKKKESSDTSAGAPMLPNPSPTKSSSSSLAPILLIAIPLVVLLAGFFLWKSLKTNSTTVIHSKSVADDVRRRSDLSNQEKSDRLLTSAATKVAPSVTPAQPENRIAAEVTPVSTQPSANSGSVEEKLSTQSVAEAGEPIPPPAPPPLKLQGIFYRLSNPTALINGKTLGVGETVAGARVVKIERQEVSLERDGQITVLRMK